MMHAAIVGALDASDRALEALRLARRLCPLPVPSDHS
jgi:hypothetical protein